MNATTRYQIAKNQRKLAVTRLQMIKAMNAEQSARKTMIREAANLGGK